MHMSALVIVPEQGADDPEKWVESIMAPHEEIYTDDSHSGFWDWWQIGGRYTGLLDDYDPHLDHANIETCTLFGGSGVRPDGLARFGQNWVDWSGGCNGCSGKGAQVKWPTSWATHPGDIAPVTRAAEVQSYTVVSPDGAWHKENWTGDDWVENTDYPRQRAEALLKYRTGVVVVVDYHS